MNRIRAIRIAHLLIHLRSQLVLLTRPKNVKRGRQLHGPRRTRHSHRSGLDILDHGHILARPTGEERHCRDTRRARCAALHHRPIGGVQQFDRRADLLDWNGRCGRQSRGSAGLELGARCFEPNEERIHNQGVLGRRRLLGECDEPGTRHWRQDSQDDRK